MQSLACEGNPWESLLIPKDCMWSLLWVSARALLPQESGNTQATIFFGTEPFFLPKAQNISREMGKSISTDPAVHDTLARIKKLSVVRHFLHIIVGWTSLQIAFFFKFMFPYFLYFFYIKLLDFLNIYSYIFHWQDDINLEAPQKYLLLSIWLWMCYLFSGITNSAIYT